MEANNMTLDEAIAHCNEVAVACDTECRREHKQLADWLRELKDRRCYQGGNAAAMREALEKIAHYDDNDRDMDDPYCADGHICADIARKALSAPPRNCDVGTAEEQTARYDKFCYTNRTVEKCCTDCPALGVADCEFVWAQMPYEEGATK